MGMANEHCVSTGPGGAALERRGGHVLVVPAAVYRGQSVVGAADTRNDADWRRLFV